MTDLDLSRAAWRKSSYSGANGSCVEVAPVPAADSGKGGPCGTAASRGRVAVRDSKDRAGPALVFTGRQWRAFTAGIRDGSLDLS